jgi:hypothetical protein
LTCAMLTQRTNFGWLGAGIYFGDAACTTTKYAAAGSQGTRFMLVASVALGTTKEYTKVSHLYTYLERVFERHDRSIT